MKNERPDGWVSVSLHHRLGLMRGLSLPLRRNFMRPAASDPISLIMAPQETGDPEIVSAAIAHPCVMRRRPVGSRGFVLPRGIVSLGSGPRRVFSDIVDSPRAGFRTGGIFSRPRPSFDRRSGSALVPGKRRKQTWARCPPPSSRASCSAGPRSIPPAAICGLTRKSEFGDFSLGPILMAQINSRRRNKKRA